MSKLESKLRKPIPSVSYGYVIVFEVKSIYQDWKTPIASAVLKTLVSMDFNGRCEYYTRDDFFPKTKAIYHVLGLAIRNEEKGTMAREWWNALYQLIENRFLGGSIKVIQQLSEPAEARAIRQHGINQGVILMSRHTGIEILQDQGPKESFFLKQAKALSPELKRKIKSRK